MEYDFDQVINRKGTNCIKYDFVKEYGKKEDVLPLWVADMDFQTAQPIRDRLGKILEHGLFGYSDVKEEYFRAVTGWYRKRFGWETEKEWMVQTPGVVFALSIAVRAFTREGDAVLIQPPVYYPFFRSVEHNNRRIVTNSLELAEGHYEINFEDFESKIVEHQVKLFLLCSPHNPVGRVWKEWELNKLASICQKHQVLIVTDEIHSDFTYPGYTHRMLADVCPWYQDSIITCTAPSKTFNLAGLQASNIFIPNPELRELFRKEMQKIGYSHLNLMGMAACQAAYEGGEEWLDQLKDYLTGNLAYVREYLKRELPVLKLIEPEGTYLLWVDFRELRLSEAELEHLIAEEAGLWLDAGSMFGMEGKGFERINIACPRSILEKALQQLKEAVDVTVS